MIPAIDGGEGGDEWAVFQGGMTAVETNRCVADACPASRHELATEKNITGKHKHCILFPLTRTRKSHAVL